MRKRLFLSLLLATLAWPAAAQDVSRDFDEAYDFSKLKTFSIKVTPWGNSLAESRVSGDFVEALTSKGWRLVPEASADALVVLNGATANKKNITTFYDGWGGWGYSGWGSSTTMVSDYIEGTLVADIFDARTWKLVYRGSATAEINKDPQKNIKKAEKAAQKMFKDFPPKPRKS